MEDNKDKKLFCGKCKVELVPKKVDFKYMRFTFTHEVPACPICGQAYLTEEVVTGKLKEVEKAFEEK